MNSSRKNDSTFSLKQVDNLNDCLLKNLDFCSVDSCFELKREMRSQIRAKITATSLEI